MDCHKKSGIRWWGVLLICLSVLLALAAAAAGLAVWIWNENVFTLELTVHGQEEVWLEHGTQFIDAGAGAQVSGTILCKDVRPAAVETYGSVDTQKLGTYELVYRAEYVADYYVVQEKLQKEVKRTVHVVDTAPPQIILHLVEGSYTLPGAEYAEEGYTATDDYDGDITHLVQRTVENGAVTYTVSDSSGNTVQITRDIFYDDPIAPVLTLKGPVDIQLVAGDQYEEPGFSAQDNCDADITAAVTVTGEVNSKKAGVYIIEYAVQDSWGNTATAKRTVAVMAKPHAKVPANANGKVIYLTFDDGPSKYTPRLLDILDQYGVKATFFVVGTQDLSIISRMVASGHTVALHTNTHVFEEIYTSEEAFLADLHAVQAAVAQYTGYNCKMIRFAGGSGNTVSAKYNEGIMTRLVQCLRADGYQYFDWNVSSLDSSGLSTAEDVFQTVISEVSKHQYSVVLQHDIFGYSVEAVDDIIQWGLENGYTFRALDMNSPNFHFTVRN